MLQSDPIGSSAPAPVKVDKSKETFKPHEDGQLGEGGYNREVPEHFGGDSHSNPNGDTFMRSVLKEFAHEGKNKDGSPNGKFTVDRSGASALGMRVL